MSPRDRTAGGTVHLVRGDDPSLVRDEVQRVVEGLVGAGDRSLVVSELAGDDYESGRLVDAAQTPPFLTARRVVVGRDAHRFTGADALVPLLAYLGDPLATTDLVLVWEAARVPKALLDAIERAGGATITASPGRDQKGWVAEHLSRSGLHLDGRARQLVVDTLGEDLARLRGVIETLTATFGPGARLVEDDVRPYLGEAGALAPWQLTDAIDRGDIPTALDRLHRTLGPGDRHPLQVLFSLHGHYGRMLALDGAQVGGRPIRGEKDAAALLGLRGSTYPARKALEQARRLGHERLARAVILLAEADLDLRGAKAWPEELVMEVLVARLASVSRR